MKNLEHKKGFTIIEIVFAVVLLAFFIYFIANSFVTTKRQHGMNSEYITKAYIADIVIKMLKERIEVNSNFLAGINGLLINRFEKEKSRSCMVNPMAGNIKYSNLFDKSNYHVEIRGIPVISYSDPDKKEGFYFGMVDFRPGDNLFSSDEGGFKSFLNIEELEKYAYDLKIENDPEAEPTGIVKNIEVSVFFTGGKEEDQNPFNLTTKVICPINSLSSSAYREIQKNLFNEIAQDIYESIRNEMERNGLSLGTVVAGIERDCKASTYSTMKVVNLNMPESSPDRPRAKEIIKNVLVLHCALELYQEAVTEIERELAQVEDKTDVISIVRIMDKSVQKAQWALQTLEAINEPLDIILEYLRPSGIEPPNPDAMFNYQVPIVATRYLLSRSEKDTDSTRLARFIGIGNNLPGDYSSSMALAFKRVNALLNDNYRKLTARQIQKYSRDLLSFHQLVWINSRKLRIGVPQTSTHEYSRQASATLDLINDYYKTNNFLAGNEFIECEARKIKQFNSIVHSRFAEIINKIEGFNGIEDKLKRLKKMVLDVDKVARGEEGGKLVSTPYEINMETLSEIYITRGREAVKQYLIMREQQYQASLRD